MNWDRERDLIIVGGGIGGVISLKYAKDAGLDAQFCWKAASASAVFGAIFAWQDIQFRKEDWTLGDLPDRGRGPSEYPCQHTRVGRAFRAFAFDSPERTSKLGPYSDGGWHVDADGYTARARFLIAATGGHNRPVVPHIERTRPTLIEYHSSALRNPAEITGKDVVVVGGGASAYDLLDLCFEWHARSVTWVYRSLKWMRPTLRPKYFGTDMRALAKAQMLGTPLTKMNRQINLDLRARYKKAGLDELLPEHAFDFGNQQFIPGRRRMIENFASIARHRSEIVRIESNTVRLASGAACDADLVLWGTDTKRIYATWKLTRSHSSRASRRLVAVAAIISLARCAESLHSAPGVLETSGSTPWAYPTPRSPLCHISAARRFSVRRRSARTQTTSNSPAFSQSATTSTIPPCSGI